MENKRRAMPRPAGQEYASTAWTSRSRVERRCDGYRCPRRIFPGDKYARMVAFPGHEAVGGNRPWVLKLCERCATENGQPMPPTQAERRSALTPNS